MEVRSYLDDYDTDCGSTKPANVKILNDGRRAKEKVRTRDLGNGTVEEVHEIFEEKLPMELRQRISRKIQTVPVEEVVECIDEEGNVQKKVTAFGIDGNPLTEPVGVDKLAGDVKALRASIDEVAEFIKKKNEDAPVKAVAAVETNVAKNDSPELAASVGFAPAPMEKRPFLASALKRYGSRSQRQAVAAVSDSSVEVAVQGDSAVSWMVAIMMYLLLGGLAALITVTLFQ